VDIATLQKQMYAMQETLTKRIDNVVNVKFFIFHILS